MLATPCTAPYLGTALGFAFAQSAGIILLMFAAIALGMSVPYFLLSAQPAWLRFVPKPGAWMVRVKQFMGFLLIATLLFLLWVIGVARGIDAAIWVSAFLLALSIGSGCSGSFSNPVASLAQRSLVLVLILVLVLGSGFYFIGEKFGATKTVASALTKGDWIAFSPSVYRSSNNGIPWPGTNSTREVSSSVAFGAIRTSTPRRWAWSTISSSSRSPKSESVTINSSTRSRSSSVGRSCTSPSTGRPTPAGDGATAPTNS